MAIVGPTPNPVDDPEFYCHGQACIDGGCSPLLCKDDKDETPDEWDSTRAAATTGEWENYSYLDSEEN